MIKEKQMTIAMKSFLWILVVLTLSFYLEFPVLMASAGQIFEEKTSASKGKITVAQELSSDKSVHTQDKANSNQQTAASGNQQTESTNEVQSDTNIELIVSDAKAETIPEGICLNANRGGVADRKEIDVLIHLINAEAYGLSYEAKVAVGQVVMNRWVGPYYGDDLLAIMTAPYQFTPIYDGSAYDKEVEPDSIKAAYAVLEGTGVKELTGDTYYFVNPDFTEDKTIEQKMEFVCEIENIHFYKPPAK